MEPLKTTTPEQQSGDADSPRSDQRDCFNNNGTPNSEISKQQEGSKRCDDGTLGAREAAESVRKGEGRGAGGIMHIEQPQIRQPLLRAIHHELSQLTAEADGVSEKVKRIINRQRRRLDSLIEETSKAPRMLSTKIAVPLEKRRRQVRGNIRRAVTGDPLKSVRLHLQEKRSKPFMMRMMDKAAFTVGVLTMIVSEYVLLLMPERFWLWYSVMIPVLLLMRYPDYRQRKWLFFYLDFCYYVQVCCMIAIFVLPHDCRLNKVIFMYTMGSLLWAVPLWRNSLVFHDVDKMTSCFIHLFPSWLALTLRWCPLDPWRGGSPGMDPECSEGINLGDMGMALFLYVLWQLLYYIKTEYQDRSKLDADPEIQTSLRWLTTSPKNKMHQIVLWMMRRLKFFKKDETFDPHTLKTKMIFMGSQLVYTLIVSLPTPFLYNNKLASVSLVLIVFVFALWNSSNYYIDVFSRRYWATMEAEAAAKTEALLIKAAKVRERELSRELDGGSFNEPVRTQSLGALSRLSTSSSTDGIAPWRDSSEIKVDLGGGSGSGSCGEDINSPGDGDEDERDAAAQMIERGGDEPVTEKSKDV